MIRPSRTTSAPVRGLGEVRHCPWRARSSPRRVSPSWSSIACLVRGAFVAAEAHPDSARLQDARGPLPGRTSTIRTVPSAPEFHRFLLLLVGARPHGRNRRSGIGAC